MEVLEWMKEDWVRWGAGEDLRKTVDSEKELAGMWDVWDVEWMKEDWVRWGAGEDLRKTVDIEKELA
nr:hypothetical protein [Tanacetum cinerariifolium]